MAIINEHRVPTLIMYNGDIDIDVVNLPAGRDAGSRVAQTKIGDIPAQYFRNDTATSSNSGTTSLGCRNSGISSA